MNLFEQRPLMVLLDVESSIVLGTVPSLACGQMLMLGMLNSQVNYFPIQAAHRKTEWDGYDFNGERMYVMERGWKLVPAAEQAYTPAIAAKRRLMRMRISYLHPWEIYCRGSLVRFKGYMSDAVQAYLRSEVDAREESRFIREYASINDISDDNAAEEIASKVQSLGLIEARNWAQYEKIARDMAVAQTRAVLEQCMARGFDILYNNAYV